MSIKHVTLNNAIRMLSAIGANFAIEFEGEMYGNLQVIKPTKRKSGADRKPLGYYTTPERKALMEKMKVGDVVVITTDPEETESVRASIQNYASKLYGHGSVTTHVIEDTVEFLRIS